MLLCCEVYSHVRFIVCLQDISNEPEDGSGPRKVVIKADYSQNLPLEYDQEIQSLHWSHPQVRPHLMIIIDTYLQCLLDN
jgi:hypothetical protein